MPYGRRQYRRRYTRRTYRPTRSTYAMRRIARSEVNKNNNKTHPINYHDVNYTGDYVKTTPNLLSFGVALANYIDTTDLYDNAPARWDAQNNRTIRVLKVRVTGFAYQFRFQQNDAAVEAYADTVRTMAYLFNDTYDENPNAILSGGDIDQAPNTLSVHKMYHDRCFFLRAGLTETTTDDNQFVPGTRIIKGYKKTSVTYTFEFAQVADTVTHTEGPDIRIEHASDDNSSVGEVELYGYVRIYFRVVN